MRGLRTTAIALVVLIEVTGALTKPTPGFSGHHLGVLLGLVGVVVGMLGVMRTSPCATARQIFFFGLLVASSVTLFWLQPNGPGFLATFLAVTSATLRIRASMGAAVAVVAVVAQAVVGAVANGGRSVGWLALNELGVLAFFVVALLARRLREGQEQAERMLAELEQSRETQARAVALAERQRLAREMHDVLAHSLSGLVLQLEGARLLATQRQADGDLTGAVERAHHLAKAGLEEARRAIGLLRDDELPGPERLQALASSFTHDTGTTCTLEVDGRERALSSEARLTLYRVAQEALTNVRKHSAPARVEIHLSYEMDGTQLTVEDFGLNGSSAPSPSEEGYGLTGMRERAELLGGELTATATKTGFRVDLWVPA
jgi:signal transduction histidine kinase